MRSQAVGAIRGWCRRDPIAKIGDLTVDIALFTDSEMDELATGPTQLVISVPVGVPTRFVAADPGFGHLGYDVRFAESGELVANDRSVEVQVEAYAPALNPPEGALPLLMEFTALGGGPPAPDQAEGQANAWVTLRSNLLMRDFVAPPPPPPPPDDSGDPTPPVPPDPSSDEPPPSPPDASDDTPLPSLSDESAGTTPPSSSNDSAEAMPAHRRGQKARGKHKKGHGKKKVRGKKQSR